MDFLQTSSIEKCVDKIPNNSKVVFDWDNTLKVASADRKKIESSLSKESLNTLVKDKKCTLYIISAIRPTRMNLDTLMIEVDKLGLRRYFCPECRKEHFSSDICSHNIVPEIVREHHTYAHWGNIVICGYDKAEVFLELSRKDSHVSNQIKEEPVFDEVDGVCDGTLKQEVKWTGEVYFFDDEEINIENFSQIVTDSVCILVKWTTLL